MKFRGGRKAPRPDEGSKEDAAIAASYGTFRSEYAGPCAVNLFSPFDECSGMWLLTIIINKNTIFPDDRDGSVDYDNEGWTQDEAI